MPAPARSAQSPRRRADHPQPLLVLEIRFRLEGCRTDQEKRQRLAPLFRHWGRQPYVALREEPLSGEPERAAITAIIALPSSTGAQREADDLLAWTERNLSAWIEDFWISEH